MDQGQKLLYMTHLILVVNTCTKYEKDPSNGRKAKARTRIHLQIDRQTDVQPETSIIPTSFFDKEYKEFCINMYLAE